MKNKVLGCLMAGALSTALALASPAYARGGGGGGGGMHGGGGGWGGGAHFSGMSGGPHFSAMSSGPHFSGMSSGPRFSGSRFASSPFAAHAAFSPRFSRFGFHDGRFHHRSRHFAFVGAPFAYAAYDSCWRRVWTPYGLQWTNVCGDYYGYYGDYGY
jgi:hypothetical protein